MLPQPHKHVKWAQRRYGHVGSSKRKVTQLAATLCCRDVRELAEAGIASLR